MGGEILPLQLVGGECMHLRSQPRQIHARSGTDRQFPDPWCMLCHWAWIANLHLFARCSPAGGDEPGLSATRTSQVSPASE